MTNLHEYLHTNRFCPKCGKELKKEIHKTYYNYDYVCKNCDENFFYFETKNK